jgi:glucosylceramidase
MWTPEQLRDFIKDHLGPTLQDNKDTRDLKIMTWDHNKDKVVEWSDVILADADANKYIYGIAVHWYSGDEFQNVGECAKKYSDKVVFATEACLCPYQPGQFDTAEKYVHDIIGDIIHGVVGWTDWYVIR